MKIEWEEIQSDHGEYLARAKVYGGWLVKCTMDVMTALHPEDVRSRQGFEWRTSLTFVPDPNYAWGKSQDEVVKDILS